MSRIISFTERELHEVRRALRLIMEEDLHCDVNMDDASVAAKVSACRKLGMTTSLLPGQKKVLDNIHD